MPKDSPEWGEIYQAPDCPDNRATIICQAGDEECRQRVVFWMTSGEHYAVTLESWLAGPWEMYGHTARRVFEDTRTQTAEQAEYWRTMSERARGREESP